MSLSRFLGAFEGLTDLCISSIKRMDLRYIQSVLNHKETLRWFVHHFKRKRGRPPGQFEKYAHANAAELRSAIGELVCSPILEHLGLSYPPDCLVNRVPLILVDLKLTLSQMSSVLSGGSISRCSIIHIALKRNERENHLFQRSGPISWERLITGEKAQIGQTWGIDQISLKSYEYSPAGLSAQIEFPDLPLNLLLFAHMAIYPGGCLHNLKVLLRGSLLHRHENGREELGEHVEIFCRNEAFTGCNTHIKQLSRLSLLDPILPFRRIRKEDNSL